MSHFVPSTYVALFQDGTIPDARDAWDNPVPVTAPPASAADVANIPALLTEYGNRTEQPAEGAETVVHKYLLRMRPRSVRGLTITPRDRVLDQRTGRYFEVDEVPEVTSTVQVDDVRLVLRRVS